MIIANEIEGTRNKNKICDITVSCDGTWQKRGYNSPECNSNNLSWCREMHWLSNTYKKPVKYVQKTVNHVNHGKNEKILMSMKSSFQLISLIVTQTTTDQQGQWKLIDLLNVSKCQKRTKSWDALIIWVMEIQICF